MISSPSRSSAGLVPVLGLLAFALALPSAASAQATRTWVSGVGDDANPCSRTAPCKTFAGAIAKTAAGGEIDALDSGGFGAVTITKAITLDGRATNAGVLGSAANGIVVNAGVNDRVTLRNLSINGAGSGLDGVKVLAAGHVRIEDLRIGQFVSDGIEFAPVSGRPRLTVQDTSIHRNTDTGVRIAPSLVAPNKARVLLRRTDVDDNGNGVTVNGTAGRALVHLFSSSIFENGTDSGTGVGIDVTGDALARISDTEVSANGIGLQTSASGLITSYGDNLINANVVSDGNPTATVPRR